MLDKNGERVDTIWHGQAYELANGPLISFYDNGIYSMKFTPKNTNTGKWIYHTDTKTMTLQLLIDPKTWPGSDVVKRKLALKFNDDKYYEKLEYKIFQISSDTLKYLDYSDRHMIYKKIK